MGIKAIETRYKGYRFRSRLEARWAVFFDTLELEWEYEPQGFLVPGPWPEEAGVSARPYLPDFLLPETETWCEVKGDPAQLDFGLLADAVDWGGALPGVSNSLGTARGLLILGPIPSPQRLAVLHPMLQHSKGGRAVCACFVAGGLAADVAGQHYFDSMWGCHAGQEWAEWVGASLKGLTADEYMDPYVVNAYRAARSARFEHGEAPR